MATDVHCLTAWYARTYTRQFNTHFAGETVLVHCHIEYTAAVELNPGITIDFHYPLLLLFLWAGVQPTLYPYAEAFYDRPIALTQEGRSLVNDVCECMRD